MIRAIHIFIFIPFLFYVQLFQAQNTGSGTEDPVNYIINFTHVQDTLKAQQSLEFLEKEDYRKALRLAEEMSKKEPNESAWYFIRVLAYSQLGKQKKMEKIFGKAFEMLDPSALLYYNYGVKKYKEGVLSAADQFIQQSIQFNNSLPQAHLMLSRIHKLQGKRIKAILPLYTYFLFLPEGQKDEKALSNLKQLLFYGIEVVNENGLSISMPFSKESEDNELLQLEIELNALKVDANSKDQTENRRSIKFTETIFKYLNSNRNLREDIWWSFYAKILGEMANNGFVDAFVCYDLLNMDKAAEECLKIHPETIEAYKLWKENI